MDVLPKPVEPAVMIEAIQSALRLSAKLQGQHKQARSIRQRFDELTARELELLRLVVDGQSNKAIASQMGISIKTVANHRANLMAKTGALNAADLARLATLAGIAASAAGPVISPNPASGQAV